MSGAFGGDGEAIELAGKTDGEIADVDHFLDFAETLGWDLADLDRHQPAELVLVRAQFFAKQAHQFAALRTRHQPPGLESLVRGIDGLAGVRRRNLLQRRDLLARHRAAHDEVAAGKRVLGDAEFLKK